MFVFSFSSKKVKKVLIIGLSFSIVVSAVVLSACILNQENHKNTVTSVGADVSDSSGILAFISTLGWEVDEEPDEVREVVIPSEFDEVYANYNAIQLKQGYDLKKYAGERVKRWTYTVNNYPGYVEEECIKLNILIFEDKVIGGDVCSVRLDGFMHGFSKEE